MNKQLQVRTPIRLKLGYFLNLFPFLNLQECFKFVWDTMVYFFNLNQLHCSSAGSKVQVTFHRSRVQDAAPSINYQITQIPLEEEGEKHRLVLLLFISMGRERFGN